MIIIFLIVQNIVSLQYHSFIMTVNKGHSNQKYVLRLQIEF